MNKESFVTPINDKKWLILSVMSVCLAIVYTGLMAIVISISTIQQAFQLSPNMVQWVVNIYMVAFGTLLILGGRLGELFQPQRALIAGLFIFILGSVICACSPDITLLLIGRAIQGIGGSLIVPNTSVIVINSFSQEEKGKAMGVYIASSMVILAFFLTICGFITQFLSWNWIFWINLPIVIICYLIIIKNMKKTLSVKKITLKELDWFGSISCILAISFLIIAILELSNKETSFLVVGCWFLFSFLFFLLTYFIEKKVSNPLINLAIFENKLVSYSVVIFFLMACCNSFFLFYMIYIQNILGFKAASSSLFFLPNILCLMMAAPYAGIMLDKHGYKLPITIGLLLMFFGILLNASLIKLQTFWCVLPGTCLINIGIPFVLSPISTISLNSVDISIRSSVSGILSAVKEIANSLGLAVLTTVITGSYNYLAKSTENIQANSYLHTAILHHESLVSYHIQKTAYIIAYGIGLYTSAFLIFIAIIYSFFAFKKLER